jgi:hypothetical protein
MSKFHLILPLLVAIAFLPPSLAAEDQGAYLILNAQYGTAEHHVDVTNRLKELARQDRVFRMDNRTFGVDPDRGHTKFLRIYASGPDGQERVFEYREGSNIDGAQFRGWGRGEWGNGEWNAGWEGHRAGIAQPNMDDAIQHLREAQQSLAAAATDKGGHRTAAMQLIDQALAEVQAGIQYDNEHLGRDRDRDRDRH